MLSKKITFIVPITAFLWVGFVCAISFMEAWLKFRAPGVTLHIGLGIGLVIFNSLNIMEWIFAAIMGTCLVISRSQFRISQIALFSFIGLLFFIQSIFLLPALNDRAANIIAGHTLAPSFVHIYYFSLEIIKVGLLFILGVWSLIWNGSRLNKKSSV